MNDAIISTRLVELYSSIRSEEVSISDIDKILDENFVLHAKNCRDILLPLTGACRKENLDVLKFLVQHEMYSNITKPEVFSLLNTIGDQDNSLGFDFLVKAFNFAADIDAKETFERCCSLGCKNMVKYLLHPERPWKIDINLTSGLEYACVQENKELVIYLLDNGADISNKNYVAVTVSFTNDSLDLLNYFLFDLDIDLYKMTQCVSQLKVEPQEEILLERFLQVVDNAILTNNLNKKLTSKTTKASHKI